jgi:hypothetical protein
MHSAVVRKTVDLSSYPDLVVVYLGMKAKSLRGFGTLFSFGPKLQRATDEKPDGLLHNENFFWGLFPPHAGIRQYWRDFESLERWTRALPHQRWWQDFLRDARGTEFWHETYFMRGGMSSIFLNVDKPLGFSGFAPTQTARGSMFSTRRRLKLNDGESLEPAVTEQDLYTSRS